MWLVTFPWLFSKLSLILIFEILVIIFLVVIFLWLFLSGNLRVSCSCLPQDFQCFQPLFPHICCLTFSCSFFWNLHNVNIVFLMVSTRFCSLFHFYSLFFALWLNYYYYFFFFKVLLDFIYLFILFLAVLGLWFVRGLSPVAASGGHSSSRCAGLSLSRPLPSRGTGSRRAGSAIVAHGPSCSVACGIFPDQGSNPCPLH